MVYNCNLPTYFERIAAILMIAELLVKLIAEIIRAKYFASYCLRNRGAMNRGVKSKRWEA